MKEKTWFCIIILVFFVLSCQSHSPPGEELQPIINSLNAKTQELAFTTSYFNQINKITTEENHKNSFSWAIKNDQIVLTLVKEITFFKNGELIDKNIEDGLLVIEPSLVDLEKIHNDNHRVYIICMENVQCMEKESRDIWYNNEQKLTQDDKNKSKPMSEGLYIYDPTITTEVKKEVVNLISKMRNR